MNQAPETIAGDVQAFTAEPPGARLHWRSTLLTFLLLMAALCLGLWLARQKLREVISDKTHGHSLEDQEVRTGKVGRTFDLVPPTKPVVDGAPLPTSIPAALNEPIAPVSLGQLTPAAPPASSIPLPNSSSQVVPTLSPETFPDPGDERGSMNVTPFSAPGSLVGDTAGRVASMPAAASAESGRGMQQALLTGSFAPAEAGRLVPRNLLLARGAYISCVLETQLISNIAGFVSCIVSDNVYSDDGHTLLIERGSHVSGEYRSDARHGDTRLFVLWDRIKTPYGVVVDVASPGGDAVGGQGLPGYVDNHWWERIGAAFLLSTFQDAVAIAIAKQSAASSATTTVTTLPTNTTGAAQDLSKAVLDSTINIPPTIYKNRGELLTIYVARDLRFDQVYAIR